MSGHSKWHSIKHKKGALDAKRGKLFTKHAKLITIAARDGGGDVDMNPGLRTAISNAKADNVPNSNIDKAIKKGTGAGKDDVQFMELMYEGFGPAGTALYVSVITDNKNRSVANVKICFSKNGGNMGAAGSVGWMFDRKGVITTELGSKNEEEAEMEIIDAGAEDLSLDDGVFEIVTAFTDLMSVKDKLEAAGFEIKTAVASYLPKETVEIETVEDARKVLKLIDAIEDDEDVNEVYGNFNIPDEILEQLDNE